MDMIVGRKTIFFLLGCLFTGWVVKIVVNFIKKTVSSQAPETSFSDTSEWEDRRRRAGLKLQNPGRPPWQVIIPQYDCTVTMMKFKQSL